MHKFKCATCDHVAEEKGFCPKDGTELVATAGLSDELKGLLDQIGTVVEQKTKDTLKDMGFDKLPDRKIMGDPKTADEKMAFVKGILGDRDAKMLAALPSAKQEDFLKKAKVGLFFKNLIAFSTSHDPEHLKIVKALSEGDDGSGGYLVPTEFRAELVEDIKDLPVMRNLVTVIPMGTDSLELPTLASDVKTSWGSENTAISTTTARFGTLTFTPYRLNTMMYTSRELVADSAIAVVPLITRLFSQAIGRAEDTAIIAGTGSGQPTGIFKSGNTYGGINNSNNASTLAVAVKKLPFKLGTAYRRNARWVMNSTAMAAVATLKDSNGQFLYKEGVEGLTPHRLAGYEVVEQNDMAEETLLLGDLSYYYFADREQMSVETTTQGAGTFEKHQVAIKVVERIDGKVAVNQAFKTITNAGVSDL
jgi:HK97 family phage major capsid protein